MKIKNKQKNIPEGWAETTLGEVCENVSRSFDFDKHKSVVFINTGDVLEGNFLDKRTFLKEKLPGQAKKAIKENDILYSEIRPKNKRYALVDFDAHNFVVSTKFMVLLKKKESINLDFLYIYLSSPKIINNFNLIAEARSGTFPQITFDSVKYLPFPLPPLREQKQIAKILTSFDDKIDLLQAQNKTLEEIGETIFKEWFGKYQLGDELPEGWEKKPLSYFGDIICGKTPSKDKSQYFGGTIPFIKIPDMHKNTFILNTTDTLTKEGRDSQNNKILPPKSICVSCIATVGLVSMNAFESQTNQQINSIIPKKDEYRFFLYLFMKSSNNLLCTMASGGTATMNLNTRDFAKIMVSIADEYLVYKFHKIATPIFEKIFYNQSQIQILTKTRDALLPKLMSGKVRVKMLK